jgi:hypothetical protein
LVFTTLSINSETLTQRTFNGAISVFAGRH